MSLQTQFESMVAGRRDPTVPQFNPADTDVTRGLQVASFALDTVGQVVRSSRESEASDYAAKAATVMQEAYGQTNSYERATFAVNKFAANAPSWAREAIAGSAREFMGLASAGMQMDQQRLLQQQQQAEADALANEPPDLQNLVSELGDENFLRNSQLQVGFALYSAQGAGGSEPTMDFTSWTQAQFSDPTLNPAYGMSHIELASVMNDNPTLAQQARVRMNGQANAQIIQETAQQNFEEMSREEVQAARAKSGNAVLALVDDSRLGTNLYGNSVLLAMRGGASTERMDQMYINTASSISAESGFLRELSAGLPPNQAQQLITRADSLDALAAEYNGLVGSDITALERSLRRLETTSQLSQPEVTRIKAVYGNSAMSAISALSVNRVEGLQEVISDSIGELSRGDPQVDYGTFLSTVTERIQSGTATDADYNAVGITSYHAMMEAVEDGTDPAEAVQIRDELFPMMVLGDVFDSSTEQGRENIKGSLTHLAPLFENVDGVLHEDLSEDDKELWKIFRSNAAAASIMDDDNLWAEIESMGVELGQNAGTFEMFAGIQSPLAQAFNSDMTADQIREYQTQQTIQKFQDKWDQEYSTQFEGTIYQDLSATDFLDLMGSIRGSQQTEAQAENAGRVLASLYNTQDPDLIDPSIDGISLQDSVLEAIAERQEFLGIPTIEFKKEYEIRKADGSVDYRFLIDADTVRDGLLKKFEVQEPEEDPDAS